MPDQIRWMVAHGFAKQAAIMQIQKATQADFGAAIRALRQRVYGNESEKGGCW